MPSSLKDLRLGLAWPLWIRSISEMREGSVWELSVFVSSMSFILWIVDTPWTSIPLAVERDSPFTLILLLAVEMDTPCTSILLALERDHGGKGYTLHIHTDYSTE
jgi:hypothetical protein